MDTNQFALRLAPGVYIDQAGNIRSSPPPAGPTFDAPFHLPVEPSQLRDVGKQISDAFKGVAKNKDLLLALRVWGKYSEPDKAEFIELLGAISQFASTLSVVGGVLSAALAAAKLFGFLKDGPSAVETLINARFDELDARVTATANIVIQGEVSQARVGMATFSNTIRDFANQQDGLTLDQYLTAQNQNVTAHNVHIESVAAAFEPNTWKGLLSSKGYDVWSGLVGRLFTMPTANVADALPSRKPLDIFFDHRLMVPVVTLTIERYLTCIRSLSPEYRSTGDYRQQIGSFAVSIENLAKNMRDSSLARTIYRPEDFTAVRNDDVEHTLFGLGTPVISRTCMQWAVGAIDVLNHDDAFFQPYFADLYRQLSEGQTPVTKFGCIDFAWIPPAILAVQPHPQGVQGPPLYIITNPQECADAANAQAEKDHAYLLMLSGYAELLRLAALCRREATQPLSSETVKMSEPLLLLQPLSNEDVTVASGPIQFTGQVITAHGFQTTNRCSAIVRIGTQPIKRAIPAQYRVRLRTLYDLAPYESYYNAYYPGTDADGVLRMEVITSNNIESDTARLTREPTEWGTSSPRGEPIHLHGEATLMTDTVDWWTPYDDLYVTSGGAVPSLAELQAFGKAKWNHTNFPIGQSIDNASDPTRVSKEHFLANDPLPGLAWRTQPSNNRSARNKEHLPVHISWVIDWSGEQLTISLQSGPEARSFVVYVVVEEKLLGPNPPNILQTAVAVPMDGLVTLVPQSFFDKESTAMASVGKVIAEQIPKMVPDLADLDRPRPPESVFVNPLVVQRDLEFLKLNRPEEFRGLSQAVRKELGAVDPLPSRSVG